MRGWRAVATLRTVRRPLAPGEGPSSGPWNSEHNQHPGAWPFSEDRALGQSTQRPDLTSNTSSLYLKQWFSTQAEEGQLTFPWRGRTHQNHPGTSENDSCHHLPVPGPAMLRGGHTPDPTGTFRSTLDRVSHPHLGVTLAEDTCDSPWLRDHSGGRLYHQGCPFNDRPLKWQICSAGSEFTPQPHSPGREQSECEESTRHTCKQTTEINKMRRVC